MSGSPLTPSMTEPVPVFLPRPLDGVMNAGDLAASISAARCRIQPHRRRTGCCRLVSEFLIRWKTPGFAEVVERLEMRAYRCVVAAGKVGQLRELFAVAHAHRPRCDESAA